MKYHNITKDDMLNGDGLRVVLWVSGCEHHCKGCQNPVTWDPDDGLEFGVDAKSEIFEQLRKDYISGLTLSGGDPLFPGNRSSILQLCMEVKDLFPDKTIWCYTGYSFEQVKHFGIMTYIDVLVDGPFIQELADVQYHWAGSLNQKVWRKTDGKWIADR